MYAYARTHDRRVFVAVLAALIALAWLALGLWGWSPYGRYLNHEELDAVVGGTANAGAILPVLVAGWTLMTAAMMLPTSLPLITMFHTLTRRRPDRLRLVGLLIAGYLAVWAAFGLVVHVGDLAIHEVVERDIWLDEHAWLISAATLLLAGVYQFTPLKYHCLDRCRSPLSFITAHWRGRRERLHALQLGLRHGLFCLGCCWSLMLLMFAVGVGSLGWMLALGAVMATEKNLPWGRRLSAPLGAALLAGGTLVALQVLRLPL
jgi:predicted metal-binding membrane protein